MNIWLDFESDSITTKDLRVTNFHLDWWAFNPNRRSQLRPRDLEFTVEYPPTSEAGKEFFMLSAEQEGTYAALTFRFYSEQGSASFMMIEVADCWIVDLDLQVSSADETVRVFVKMVSGSVTVNNDLTWINEFRNVNFMED